VARTELEATRTEVSSGLQREPEPHKTGFSKIPDRANSGCVYYRDDYSTKRQLG